MVVAKTSTHWTFEEVERLENETGGRYELIDGAIFMMSGGSLEHGFLIVELTAQMSNQLVRGPQRGKCRPLPSDNKVRVRDPGTKSYRYPDLSVFCGDPSLHEGTSSLLTNPTLLFEVTSPSTKDLDAVVKLGEYSEIPTLQAYILVDQEERLVTMHFRTQEGWQRRTQTSGRIELPGAPAFLDIDELYAVLET